jgi:hypothetical protein
MKALTAYREVLAIREARVLIGASAASQVGDCLYNAALLGYVFRTTHAAAWVGIATICRLLPYVLLGPFGGTPRIDTRGERSWWWGACVRPGRSIAALWSPARAALSSREHREGRVEGEPRYSAALTAVSWRALSIDRCELISDRDRAAGQDVRPETGAVNKRPENARSGEPFQMRARFGQAPTNALHPSDPEATTRESVERDPLRHHVASRLLPGEIDRVEHLRFDQRQVIAAPHPAEGSSPGVVAVTLQAATRLRPHGFETHERSPGIRRHEDADHRADATIMSVRVLDGQPQVEPSEHPTLDDRAPGSEGAARVMHHAGRGAEHHDRVVALACADARKPRPGPFERARAFNRNESKISLGKPLPEEVDGVVVGLGRLHAQDDFQTDAKLRVEGRHRAIIDTGRKATRTCASVPYARARGCIVSHKSVGWMSIRLVVVGFAR